LNLNFLLLCTGGRRKERVCIREREVKKRDGVREIEVKKRKRGKKEKER
jgi:hypothetical protein